MWPFTSKKKEEPAKLEAKAEVKGYEPRVGASDKDEKRLEARAVGRIARLQRSLKKAEAKGQKHAVAKLADAIGKWQVQLKIAQGKWKELN